MFSLVVYMNNYTTVQNSVSFRNENTKRHNDHNNPSLESEIQVDFVHNNSVGQL